MRIEGADALESRRKKSARPVRPPGRFAARNWRYCAMNTEIPPLAKLVVQPGQPPGAAADEYGMKIFPVLESTPTECALLPVGRIATTAWLVPSMMPSDGVQGDAVAHVPFVAAFPEAVQRLPAL